LTSFDSGVYVVGVGAVTSIGRTAWASAAAVRAGVSGFTQHEFMVDSVGTPMTVASFPWLKEDRGISARVEDCLVGAIRESLFQLPKNSDHSSIVLILNLPSHRPTLPPDLAKRMDKRLRLDFAGVFERVSITEAGHAGGFAALHSAMQILADRPQTVCVVAGADSYLDPDILEWLESTDQLHGAGERNNAWGFVPGEGAGALLVATSDTMKRTELVALGYVRAVGLGRETQLIGTGSVCLGIGLTNAVRQALAGLPDDQKVTDVYCDMNGEPYRADEFAFLVSRTREKFISASHFVAPADCWGDIGAASALLLVGLACIAGRKGYSRGRSALVWASSVNGERGAAVVETAGPQ
jgi:3-oxoacyl-[acyl-carrier-protein] synthase-1